MTNMNDGLADFGDFDRDEFDGIQEISVDDAEQVAGGFGFYPGGNRPKKDNATAERIWFGTLLGGWKGFAQIFAAAGSK